MVMTDVQESGTRRSRTGHAPRRQALYVTHGSFSHINDQLLAALKVVLPDVQFERVDIAAALKKNYPALMRCALGVQSEYGVSSWQSREKIRYRLARSAAYNAEARAVIARHVGKKTYDFTIQTQSLFNAAIRGTPNYVYTDHVARAGGKDRQSIVGVPSKAWFDCEQGIYEQADHVFTFGPSIRRFLTDTYKIPARKTSAIGAGASVMPTRPVDTSAARYGRRNIVFVGVEWERKGGPELLAAYLELRKRLPDVTLTILGCSPEVPADAGIEVLGRRPLSELEDHFHNAACFCMPSRLEPFGVVFVEAMQFGLPVVSTDVGDIPAIVRQGETGFITPQGNIAALTDALFDTLSDADRCRAMGLKALDRARCFTWQAVARQIAAKLPVAANPDIPLLEPTW